MTGVMFLSSVKIYWSLYKVCLPDAIFSKSWEEDQPSVWSISFLVGFQDWVLGWTTCDSKKLGGRVLWLFSLSLFKREYQVHESFV